MAKNYMADVAKMLGVELGEEFKLTGYSGTFMLTNKGIMWLAPDKRRSREVFALEGLLIGRRELVRLPWQPKKGDEYYYPGEGFNNICRALWGNTVFGFAYKEAGLIFKTYEECKAALPELRKKYLGGGCNEAND